MWDSNGDLRMSHIWIELLLSQPWFTDEHISASDGRRCWKLEADAGKEVLAWGWGDLRMLGIIEITGYLPYAEGEKLDYRVHSLVWRCCAA